MKIKYGLLKEYLMHEFASDELRYHLDNKIKIRKNIYRPGSEAYCSLFREAKEFYKKGFYKPDSIEKYIFQNLDVGEFGMFEGKKVPLDIPVYEEGSSIDEAKYKGREVKLGAAGAKRSGGKSYVYVRDPKTKKVKKVTFGSSMPDAMGDSPKAKKRRKSFAARHKCADKKDKTKAGYWACRATKLFGRNISGWW